MSAQEYVYVSYIASTPARLWAALTDLGFAGHASFGRSIQSDWQPGSEISGLVEDGSRQVIGKVLEAEAHKHLKLQWRVDWIDGLGGFPDTIVSYKIEPSGEVLRLTLMETYAAPVTDDFIDGARYGWPITLSSLKSLLESGQALPITAPTA